MIPDTAATWSPTPGSHPTLTSATIEDLPTCVSVVKAGKNRRDGEAERTTRDGKAMILLALRNIAEIAVSVVCHSSFPPQSGNMCICCRTISLKINESSFLVRAFSAGGRSWWLACKLDGG